MNWKHWSSRLTSGAIFSACIVVSLCGSSAGAEGKKIIVSADGGGQFATLQQAIDAVPSQSQERTVIHLKPGTYSGQFLLAHEKANVTLEGEDAATTVLTYALNVREPDPNSTSNRYPGTGVVVLADGFQAENVTFQNTSGDHGQALALRIDGDRAILRNCRLLGWQDTLLLSRARQYFRDCYIEGRVDFIYGAASAVFDRCEIHSKNGGHITAASTPQEHSFGFVFLNCRLTGDPLPWKDPNAAEIPPAKKPPLADLGRPWRPFGSVTYVDCWMGDHIKPEGWDNWRNAENEKTARYAEYRNTGPGANAARRVGWSKQLTDAEASQITAQKVLAGDDHWDPAEESRREN